MSDPAASNSTGIYLHATKPDTLPISVADCEGPYLILVFLLTLLCGVNCALYAVYIHLFGGRNRDPLLLQLAVFISVACNIVLAFYGFIHFYQSEFFFLYSTPGLDVNAIKPYVLLYHILQAIPESIGQIYFALRIAKLFDHRRLLTRFALGVVLVGVIVQFALMTWFGAAFFRVGLKSRLSRAPWVKDILSVWCVLFIAIEVAMTATTIARLLVLRRQTTMDAARRVIFKLAVYSLQGQVLLTAYSLTSLWFFRHSATGWYMPFYLLNGALYTMVLLANLIYRSAVGAAMKEAQSNYGASHSAKQRVAELNVISLVRSGPQGDAPQPSGLRSLTLSRGLTSRVGEERTDEPWKADSPRSWTRSYS
ncbi:hypothetical protein PSEUBRA_000818 [Kalmanozyma brasiliensis GHG001]|uniref:DUF6534 domain-containing protein n=1 Tax=Kalmanozyma brasiliensis (strain GHG001) TaxID=1365824 RepID=V5F2I0_KALBG|nr:uncharacterized protein PSEUBRA_000818 [Kalmanozyma brasiliensis GHG001]EST09599.1 hypothetical protein PSEUBRA_000818 [Kalmanozyma brasiliensis GHG001]